MNLRLCLAFYVLVTNAVALELPAVLRNYDEASLMSVRNTQNVALVHGNTIRLLPEEKLDAAGMMPFISDRVFQHGKLTFDKCSIRCSGPARNGSGKKKNCVIAMKMNGLVPVRRLGCLPKASKLLCGKKFLCQRGFTCKGGECKKSEPTNLVLQTEWDKCSKECANRGSAKKCVRYFGRKEEKVIVSLREDEKCFVDFGCPTDSDIFCGNRSVCETGYSCDKSTNGGEPRCRRTQVKSANTCPCVKVPKCSWCNADSVTCDNVHEYVCLDEFNGAFTVENLLKQTKSSTNTLFDVCTLLKGTMEREFTLPSGKCELKELKKSVGPQPEISIQTYGGGSGSDESTCPCEKEPEHSGKCYTFINPNNSYDRTCTEKHCERSWKCIASQKVADLPHYSICRFRDVKKRIKKVGSNYSGGFKCVEEAVNKKQWTFYQTVTRAASY